MTTSQVQIIDPETARADFDEALARTEIWWYHGHIGRWVRNAAIPRLTERAEKEGKFISIRLILIDPACDALCAQYVQYRNSIAFKEKSIYGIEDAKAEVLATIVQVALHAANNTNLNYEIYLAPLFSLLRKDISSERIFLTRIDPRSTAISVKNVDAGARTETLFNTLRADFDYATRQSKKLRIPRVEFAEYSIEIVRKVIQEIDIEILEDYSTEIDRRIASLYTPY